MGEVSLKKRHKLYVTVMGDLSDPKPPRVLAMVSRAASNPTSKDFAVGHLGIGQISAAAP